MPTLDKTIDQLNHLLVTCQDEQLGYAAFAKVVQNPQLGELFASRAQEWSGVGHRLEALITGYGGRPARHASLSGDLHRGWEGLKGLVGANDDRAMLDECLRGEALARRRYEKALKAELAPPVRRCLTDHYELLLDRQAQIRALLAEWTDRAQG